MDSPAAEEKHPSKTDAEVSDRRVARNSVRRLLVVIGDYWVMQIMRKFFFGATRYKDLQKIEGISHSTLSKRLEVLTANGIIERLDNTARKERGYRLTEAGLDLFDFSLMARQWQLHNDDEARVAGLIHRLCGSSAGYRMVCRHCKRPITYDTVERLKGPGAGTEPAMPARHYRNMSVFGKADRKLPKIGFMPIVFTDLRAIQVVGAIMAGNQAFNQIEHFTQLPPYIVVGRLKWLEAIGLVEKKPSSPGAKRMDYHLTEKGKDLWPSVVAAMFWGDRWMDDGNGPPVVLEHKCCKRRVEYAILCNTCDHEIKPGDLKLSINSGRESRVE